MYKCLCKNWAQTLQSGFSIGGGGIRPFPLVSHKKNMPWEIGLKFSWSLGWAWQQSPLEYLQNMLSSRLTQLSMSLEQLRPSLLYLLFIFYITYYLANNVKCQLLWDKWKAKAKPMRQLSKITTLLLFEELTLIMKAFIIVNLIINVMGFKLNFNKYPAFGTFISENIINQWVFKGRRLTCTYIHSQNIILKKQKRVISLNCTM